MLLQYGASVWCVFCYWLNLAFLKCPRIGILNFCAAKRWSPGGLHNRPLGAPPSLLRGQRIFILQTVPRRLSHSDSGKAKSDSPERLQGESSDPAEGRGSQRSPDGRNTVSAQATDRQPFFYERAESNASCQHRTQGSQNQLTTQPQHTARRPRGSFAGCRRPPFPRDPQPRLQPTTDHARLASPSAVG